MKSLLELTIDDELNLNKLNINKLNSAEKDKDKGLEMAKEMAAGEDNPKETAEEKVLDGSAVVYQNFGVWGDKIFKEFLPNAGTEIYLGADAQYASLQGYQEMLSRGTLVYPVDDPSPEKMTSKGSKVLEEQEAETMTREEAEKKIKEVQYAAAVGIPGEVDSRTRERLATYFLFDGTLARLMARFNWVTDDVDYSRRF